MKTSSKYGNLGLNHIILIVSIFISVTISFGQVNTDNKTDSTSSKKVEKLYMGIDNRVKISVLKGKKNLFEITIDQGTISGESGDYIIRPQRTGNATVTVKKDGKTISLYKYSVRLIPDPVAAIKGLGIKAEYTKEEIISAGGIEVYLPNFDIDIEFAVVRFTISTFGNGYSREETQLNGGKLTEKQIELIQKITAGKKIYFEDIQARDNNGSIKSVAPLIIKLK